MPSVGANFADVQGSPIALEGAVVEVFQVSVFRLRDCLESSELAECHPHPADEQHGDGVFHGFLKILAEAA
jgi:hypothetical protein